MTGSLVASQDAFVIHPDDVVYVVVDDPVLTGDPVAVVLVGGPAGPAGEPGTSVELFTEVLPAELQDGVEVTFELSRVALIPAQVQVFRNGLLEVPNVGFTATATEITFSTAPLDSDVVAVSYQV